MDQVQWPVQVTPLNSSNEWINLVAIRRKRSVKDARLCGTSSCVTGQLLIRLFQLPSKRRSFGDTRNLTIFFNGRWSTCGKTLAFFEGYQNMVRSWNVFPFFGRLLWRPRRTVPVLLFLPVGWMALTFPTLKSGCSSDGPISSFDRPNTGKFGWKCNGEFDRVTRLQTKISVDNRTHAINFQRKKKRKSKWQPQADDLVIESIDCQIDRLLNSQQPMARGVAAIFRWDCVEMTVWPNILFYWPTQQYKDYSATLADGQHQSTWQQHKGSSSPFGAVCDPADDERPLKGLRQQPPLDFCHCSRFLVGQIHQIVPTLVGPRWQRADRRLLHRNLGLWPCPLLIYRQVLVIHSCVISC